MLAGTNECLYNELSFDQFVIDLLLTNRNDKSPSIVGIEGWRFVVGKGKVNKEEDMSAIHLNEKNFEQEVLKSNLPVLVDFWAEWCGPCRAIAPIIEELSVELHGKMKVAKVDVDEAQDLAAQFEVSSIPTLLILKNGKVVEEMLGAMPKAQLLAKIQPHL